MASVLFSTVGQAIGGPLGAGVGAALGASVDSRLFRRRGRGADDGFISRSAYGEIVPRVYGRARVPGLLVWALAPVDTGAKGQGRRTQSTSFAMALSRGPVSAIGRIWADGALLRNADGVFLRNIRMRVHGAGREEPDPLILAAEGESATPSYSSFSYVVFEDFDLEPFGNRIPSLSFEVLSEPGSVRDWLAELVVPAGGAVDAATPVSGIEGYAAFCDPVSDDVAALLAAAGARIAQREGQPVVGSDARITTVACTDLVEGPRDPGSDGVIVHDRRPSGVSILFQDSDRDFQLGWQEERRSGRGPMIPMSWPAVATAPVARAIALRLLQEAEAGADTIRITLPFRYLDISAGDLVRLDPLTDWLVTRREVRGLLLQLEGRRMPNAEAAGLVETDSGRALPGPDQPVPASVASIVEPPVPLWHGQEPGLLVVVGGRDGWRGAQVSMLDGGDEVAIGATAELLPFGVLAEQLDPAADTIWDERSQILVDVSDGQGLFASRTRGDVLNGAGLVCVGRELVQYCASERLPSGLVRLTGLLRGRFGTRPAGAVAGALVMALPRSRGPFLPLTPDMTNREIAILVAGRGDPVGGLLVAHVVDGSGRSPLAPVHLRCHRASGGALEFEWKPRSRSSWGWEQSGQEQGGPCLWHFCADSGAQLVLPAQASGLRLDLDAQIAAFGAPLPSGAFRVEALGDGPSELRLSRWVRI